MKSFIQRMLVSTAIAVVSLGSSGHAMAASPRSTVALHHRGAAPVARATYRYRARLDVAAIPPYPNYSSGAAWASRSRAGYDMAARRPYPRWEGGYPVVQWAPGYPVAGPAIDVRGLIAAVLGGSVPLHYGGRGRDSGSGSYVDYSPSPDTSASDAAGWAAVQSANDAAAAAAAQSAADTQALNASMAAAEAQNDAANAATQQYLINNGM